MIKPIVSRVPEPFHSKELLARHLGDWHHGPDARSRRSDTPMEKRVRWSFQELRNVHLDLHETGYRDPDDAIPEPPPESLCRECKGSRFVLMAGTLMTCFVCDGTGRLAT